MEIHWVFMGIGYTLYGDRDVSKSFKMITFSSIQTSTNQIQPAGFDGFSLVYLQRSAIFAHKIQLSKNRRTPGFQWEFQDPKMEVPTIYKASIEVSSSKKGWENQWEKPRPNGLAKIRKPPHHWGQAKHGATANDSVLPPVLTRWPLLL